MNLKLVNEQELEAVLDVKLASLSKSLYQELKVLHSLLEEYEGVPNAKYLTVSKLAKIYGMSRTSCQRYLASAVSAGAIEHFKPRDLNGTPGSTLYNVEHFDAYIKREV